MPNRDIMLYSEPRIRDLSNAALLENCVHGKQKLQMNHSFNLRHAFEILYHLQKYTKY